MQSYVDLLTKVLTTAPDALYVQILGTWVQKLSRSNKKYYFKNFLFHT